MLMSIFSSLCAESLSKKVGGLSWDSNKVGKNASAANMDCKEASLAISSSVEVEVVKKDRDKNVTLTPWLSPAKKPQPQHERRARFAPELDGLHCFETIIPY